MVPAWLHILSIVALVSGLGCAVVIARDELRRPQHMWIMNVVWPVVALFGTAIVVWGYFRYGRGAAKSAPATAAGEAHHHAEMAETPFVVAVATGTCHCGAGCTLGDIVAEWLAFAVPGVAVWLGWHWLFAEKMFAVWVLDFIFAFGFGIVFQYFAIVPMRHLRPAEGLRAALKADALSLAAWQIGMYGFMAVASFYLFRGVLGVELQVASPEFWLMMQIAMLCGFVTSYPVNWWLISVGIKERM